MIGKSGDDEPRFSLLKLADADNYKKWAWKMRYSLESVGLWGHTLLDRENLKLVAIVFKGEDLKDDAKLECQKKRKDRIITWTKNNVKCKSYIGRIGFGHIQQEFQAVKTN